MGHVLIFFYILVLMTGIAAAIIGQVVAREEGLKLMIGGVARDLPYFKRDEIARLFE